MSSAPQKHPLPEAAFPNVLSLDHARPATKKEQILWAATELFRQAGYGSTSMDAVARLANVSKATLYAHFQNKQALFEAFVRERCRVRDEAFAGHGLELLTFEAALIKIGRSYLEILLAPDSAGMFRMVVAETPRFPELGQVFYATGPGRTHELLKCYLIDANQRQLCKIEDPNLSAWQFLGMCLSPVMMGRVLKLDSGPPDFDVDDVVHSAANVFQRRYGL